MNAATVPPHAQPSLESRRLSRTLVTRTVVLSLGLTLAACHDRAPSPPGPATPPKEPTASASVSSVPSPLPNASGAAAPSASGAAPEPALTARVKAFFAGYKDGSDFSFLRTACATPVERFITMKNADVGAVISSARHFFADKRGLSYVPDEKALRISHEGNADVARVPLTMVWGTLPPEEWTSDDDRPRKELPGAIASSILWDGLVEHTTIVDVELAFDPAGRITRYVEGPPRHARLKFQSDWACLDTFGFATALKDGEVVTDLGDVYMNSLSPKGPQLSRHVRFRSGDDAWVQDTRSYAVDNPAGGTSAGMSQCLVPADARDGGG